MVIVSNLCYGSLYKATQTVQIFLWTVFYNLVLTNFQNSTICDEIGQHPQEVKQIPSEVYQANCIRSLIPRQQVFYRMSTLESPQLSPSI